MRDGKTFYHRTIRKYTSMMGTLFNNISIRRFDENLTVLKTLKVPIAFAPKEEYITFINQREIQNPDDESAGIQIILPRMSFELTGFTYDGNRMQSVMHELVYSNSTDGPRSQYMPVPYNFNYDLNIYTKHVDDTLQVVEQILPYFNPTLNWPVTDLPQLDAEITHDIAIEITGTDFNMEYEGPADDEDRFLVVPLSFTLRGYLFRPNDDKGLIKTAIVDFFDLQDFGEPEEDQFLQKKLTAAVDPESAGPTDPHTIVETNEDFTS